MTIEFTFDVTPDENGVFDGRELARKFIGSACHLLVPYVSACPACCDNLFSAIANGVIEELHREGRERGKLEGFFMTTGDDPEQRTAAQKAHLAAAREETVELLRKGDAQNHAHEHGEPDPA
jgi:hypothetical protein